MGGIFPIGRGRDTSHIDYVRPLNRFIKPAHVSSRHHKAHPPRIRPRPPLPSPPPASAPRPPRAARPPPRCTACGRDAAEPFGSALPIMQSCAEAAFSCLNQPSAPLAMARAQARNRALTCLIARPVRCRRHLRHPDAPVSSMMRRVPENFVSA